MTSPATVDYAPPPWERQSSDTPKSWAAFGVYRDLGPSRTLAAAAAELNRSVALLADWSRAYSWVARAAAWDGEQDRLRTVAMQREVIAMAQRHARQAQRAQDAGMVPIDALMEKITEAGGLENVKNLRIPELIKLSQDAIRSLPASMQAERLARGEPTEIVQQQGITGMLVAGPVGVERLELVLSALQQAGVKIGVPVPDDDPGPVEIVVVEE